jgi:hypothetical protein
VATSKNIHTYSLSDNTSSNDIEVAIIYPKASVGVVNVTFEGENHMLIIGSGLKYKVSFCTSNEGVHVYSAFKSVHLYYALGYEVWRIVQKRFINEKNFTLFDSLDAFGKLFRIFYDNKFNSTGSLLLYTKR